ncbi:MAG: Type 1 glutamine amidotransferase-like domain-containing protein [Candidatus Woesearchaeota archaeon]
MKLLLTSNGICNKSMIDVLKKWVKKDIKIAFIPTGSHFSDMNKKFLVENYVECMNLGTLYIVDIAAIDKKLWLPRLKKANVIVMGGGSSTYLMKHIVSSGLRDELPKLLKTRVFVGISAGSMIVSKRLYSSSEFLFEKKFLRAPLGLGYVDFNIRSHFNSKKFPKLQDSYLKKIIHKVKGDMYALDNQSAVVFDNGKISVVSEGVWKLYNRDK